MVPVEYAPNVEPSNLAFRLTTERVLTKSEQQGLERLIVAWYDVGVFGGYGGSLHFMSDIAFESVFGDSEPIVEWWVDMGSADESAITVLARALDGFSKQIDVGFLNLRLGHDR